MADELVDTGFDVICHATNHALDKGKKGLTNCLNYWQEHYPDLAVLGIHDSKEDQEEIYVAECEGMRIAILNYTYGTNGIPLPGDMPYAVDLLKESRVKEDLAKAEKLADFTIVCPHWGTEYSLKKTAEQDKWVKIFYEGGADSIVHHYVSAFFCIRYQREESGRISQPVSARLFCPRGRSGSGISGSQARDFCNCGSGAYGLCSCFTDVIKRRCDWKRNHHFYIMDGYSRDSGDGASLSEFSE